MWNFLCFSHLWMCIENSELIHRLRTSTICHSWNCKANHIPFYLWVGQAATATFLEGCQRTDERSRNKLAKLRCITKYPCVTGKIRVCNCKSRIVASWMINHFHVCCVHVSSWVGVEVSGACYNMSTSVIFVYNDLKWLTG